MALGFIIYLRQAIISDLHIKINRGVFYMIKSMTGFGRAETVFNEIYEINIQIKSVNHRYADYSVKMPRIYNFLEEYIRTQLAGCISRGKVEVYVSISKVEDDSKVVKLNKPLAESYISSLKELSELGVKDDISMTTLSAFDDIFDVEYKDVDEEAITDAINEALKIALDGFIAMRISEGERLKASILEHLKVLEDHISAVEERSPQTVADYRDRLYKRLCDTLSEIGATADDSRILTEVAIFADKVAVDEETVRLRSHINEFKTTLDADIPIGKKLDFIVQEMNRETNTIGSKCNDIELSKRVVDMKSVIEKIREQIQNIE